MTLNKEDYTQHLNHVDFSGSYKKEDCLFVLKQIHEVDEEDNLTREQKMKNGVHYSEMLPIENLPSKEYLDLFYESLNESAPFIAKYVAAVSESVLKDKGKDVILVSLARAGTPIGVLMKRYIQYKYEISVPHYSISIIRGKGIDKNAILYITNHHHSTNIQFVDGWTGKGAIGKALKESMKDLKDELGITISSDLAVLADPGYCAEIYGTRSDFFLASSCLNSIVSGLVSRTVHRNDLVGEYDYHACKYYADWEEHDLSNYFIDEVAKHFPSTMEVGHAKDPNPDYRGWKEIQEIQRIFSVSDINKVKPGIGETSRILLRRYPWKILVKDFNNPSIRHILLLAKEKNVPVEEYKNMSYDCIGIIKEL